MEVVIKGLKECAKVGYPVPLSDSDDEFESVYFLSRGQDGCCEFRLGTYNFMTQEFRADNGYGGEVYDKDSVVAWNYWYDDDGKYTGDGEEVSFVPVE